jgi:arginyl-tRNA synthetase
MLKEQIQEILGSVLRDLQLEPPVPLQLDVPRDRRHGDLSSNVALVLAKDSGMPPAQLARRILEGLQARPDLEAEVSLAGPGFINFRLHATNLSAALADLLRAGLGFGRSAPGSAAPIQLEFVSANPTGPLNVVSARAAAYGSTLAAMLRYAGHDVQCEFYVNDAGRQVELLGISVRARLAESRGSTEPFPEDGYHGEYVRELAAAVPAAQAETWMALPEPASSQAFGTFAVERMLESQKADLEKFGVRFDRWFRESELHASAAVEATRQLLVERGHTYEKDGALFFRSTTWNDDKDRVLVRSDGRPTYFLADAAYHRDKHERRFRHVLDVWGPDHHGHVVRMQALARALGYEEDWLEVIIVQWVRLLEAGETVIMSKRAGQIVTLSDLVDEVGADVAKYFFLMRQQSSHLDFDLDLARKKSEDNPVYYVKYAHARICSVIRKAAAEGIRLRVDEPLFDGTLQLEAAGVPRPEEAPLERLETPEDQRLLKLLLDFGDLVRRAAAAREPHRLTNYCEEVARAFHKFYHEHRVIQEDRDLALARLALCHATRRVLASALDLMSISAPEAM